MNIMQYADKVREIITPNWSHYVQFLIGTCNMNTLSVVDIGVFLSGDGDIVASRKLFNLMEGCNRALDSVVNYRAECYNPCYNMLCEINRILYNGYQYPVNGSVNEAAKELLTSDDGDLKHMTHAADAQELFTAMCNVIKS